MNTTQKTEFVVKSSAAAMPSSCWGRYRRVAVLEVEVGTEPTMISTRAKGVVRIVCAWEKLNVGRTDRCAYQRALAEAQEMAAELNALKTRVVNTHSELTAELNAWQPFCPFCGREDGGHDAGYNCWVSG